MKSGHPEDNEEMTVPSIRAKRDRLLDDVRAKAHQLSQSVNELVEAKVRLEVYYSTSRGELPSWVFPESIKRASIAELVQLILTGHAPDGLKLRAVASEIRKYGRKPQIASISATLGRLKREGKVRRAQGGYWTLVEPEEKLEGEIPFVTVTDK